MADGSEIEWLQRPGTKPATLNPIVAYRDVMLPDGSKKRLRGWHCEHVHGGCVRCYAEAQNKAGARHGTKLEYKPGNRDKVSIELHEPTLLRPMHWRDPRTIFVCSMTDLYGAWVPDEWIDKVKAVESQCPQHTFIELTKRPDRMQSYESMLNIGRFERATQAIGRDFPPPDRRWPMRNVWGLTSCSTQEDLDAFAPALCATKLAVRGLSLEPLLGRIRIPDSVLADIDWVIVGGESGSKDARAMHVEWAVSIVEQCRRAGVFCFVKQLGKNPLAGGLPLPSLGRKGGDWSSWPTALRVREFPLPKHA